MARPTIRKRSTPDVAAPVVPTSDASDPEPSGPRERISIPLTPDGRIDFDRMHGKTRDQVRSLLTAHAPDVARASGPAPATIPPQIIRVLYATLGTIEQSLAVRFLNCTPAEAGMLAYTTDDVDALEPSTQKVLNKYVGPLLSHYGEESELIATLGMIIMGKLTALRMELAHRAPVATVPGLHRVPVSAS